MPNPTFRTCVPQVPSIDFAKGTGIFIDSNLPQSNSFSAYSHFPVPLENSVFTDAAKRVPTNSFWGKINAVPAAYLEAYVIAYLQNNYASAIVTKQVEQSSIVQIPNPAFDIVKARRDHPPYMVPETISATRTVLQSTKMFANLPFDEVVARVKTDKVNPIVSRDFANNLVVSFISAPTVQPRLYVVEEYRVAAYLGKYGLGRVVRTFSLLPGEKTTITLKTYRDMSSTQTASQNVLDSFSQTSANELEKLVQGEQTNASSNSATDSSKASVSLSASYAGIGASAGYESASSSTSTRATNAHNLNKALEKHVNTSNANRQITINTTTTETVKETEESATVRELANINKSRVLNFIFRQLHQQYITVTYLADVKFAFTNGYEENFRFIGLEELDSFLNTYIVAGQQFNVQKALLKNYCSVYNYTDKAIPFLERRTQSVGGCFPAYSSGANWGLVEKFGMTAMEPANDVTFWRKSKLAVDTVPDSMFGFKIEVPGVILSVQENTLKTSSVLVESLLGQADALDCFSMKIQDAEAQRGYQDLTERELRIQSENAKAQQDLKERELRIQNENAKAQFEREKAQFELEQTRQKWEMDQKYLHEFEQKKKETELDLMRLQVDIIRGLGDPKQQAEMYKRVFGTCCETAQTVIQK